MSRGNILLFNNRSESKAKMNFLFRAATGCGLFFRLQQFLVVAFQHSSHQDFRLSACYFGEGVLLALEEIDSMLRTVMVSVLGSRVPTTFTFSPAHCSARTCASSL